MSDKNYVKWFRHSSPYINAHRGKTFVLMIPGAAIEHANFANMIEDVALLNSLGVKLVLVHGARPQIEKHLQRSGLDSDLAEGLRITDLPMLSCVAQATGEVRFQIEAALSMGLPNSPLHGAAIKVASGNYVTAMPYGVIDGIDLQHTGKVRRINADAIHQALSNNAIVVISALGYSTTGEIFNLSHADVATHVATALNSDKLISFIEEQGICDTSGQLQRQLTPEACNSLLKSGQLPAHSDAEQALAAGYQVCQQGVPRSHIISYTDDGALISELFTRDGQGTLIHRDHYETVRRARLTDVGGILALLHPLEEKGVLVRRSRELLETEIYRFTVIEKDGMVVACAALYPFETEKTAELACVVTHPDYQRGGRAATLLEHIESQAKQLGLGSLFVLTTQTAHWFIEQGFTAAAKEVLPSEKQALYNYQRNSQVFLKPL